MQKLGDASNLLLSSPLNVFGSMLSGQHLASGGPRGALPVAKARMVPPIGSSVGRDLGRAA